MIQFSKLLNNFMNMGNETKSYFSGNETRNYFFGERGRSRKIIPREKQFTPSNETEAKLQNNYNEKVQELKNQKEIRSKEIKGESIQQRERFQEDRISKCKRYVSGYVLSVTKLKDRFNKILGTNYPVDNNVDANFLRLVAGYQGYYNRKFKKKLSVDGVLGPSSIKTLRTVFNNEDFKERVEKLTNTKIDNTKNQNGKQEYQYGFTEGAKKVLNGIHRTRFNGEKNKCGMYVGNALVKAGYNEFNVSGRHGYTYEELLSRSPNFKKIYINHPNEAPIGAIISYNKGFGSKNGGAKYGHVEIKTGKDTYRFGPTTRNPGGSGKCGGFRGTAYVPVK